jgi:hypothetical protein
MSNAISVNWLTRRFTRIGLVIGISLVLLLALRAGALAVGGTATVANGHWGLGRTVAHGHWNAPAYGAVANGSWHIRSYALVANGCWHVPAY